MYIDISFHSSSNHMIGPFFHLPSIITKSMLFTKAIDSRRYWLMVTSLALLMGFDGVHSDCADPVRVSGMTYATYDLVQVCIRKCSWITVFAPDSAHDFICFAPRSDISWYTNMLWRLALDEHVRKKEAAVLESLKMYYHVRGTAYLHESIDFVQWWLDLWQELAGRASSVDFSVSLSCFV